MTSLYPEVSKSNYEADTDLLSNAKTSGIPLIGKTWLVHPSGHKYGLHIALFSLSSQHRFACVSQADPLASVHPKALWVKERRAGQSTMLRSKGSAVCMALISRCHLMKNLIF